MIDKVSEFFRFKAADDEEEFGTASGEVMPAAVQEALADGDFYVDLAPKDKPVVCDLTSFDGNEP